MEKSEIRKDYFSEKFVIISQTRKNRPIQFNENEKNDEISNNIRDIDPKCPFCKGNEHMSKEIFRIPENNWKFRVIENKYPILNEENNNNNNKNSINYFTETLFSGIGKHYVLIDSEKHNIRLHQLNIEDIETYIRTLSKIHEEMEKDPNIEYVHIFKNEGKGSGASIVHSHSQIIGFPFVPPRIREILDSSLNHPGCYIQKIIENERNSKRFIEETKHFVIFTPYASNMPYELWIIPKKHIKNIAQLVLDEIKELSIILKKYIKKAYLIKKSYNFIIYQAPKNHDFHMIIQILPRTTIWAGVELGTNIIVNPVSPEKSAEYYRLKTK